MKTQCPNCSAIFDAPNYYVGRDCRCIECYAHFIVTPYILSTTDKPDSETEVIINELPPDANEEPKTTKPDTDSDESIAINHPAVANESTEEQNDNKPEPKPKTILQQYTIAAIKSAFDAMTVCYILMAGSFVMIGWLLSELNFNMGLSIFAAIFCSLIWFIPVAFLKLLLAIASK